MKSNSFTKGYSESGRFALKVREVNADQILLMQIDPMEYIKELDLKCPGISYVSGDGLYRNDFINIEYNSLRNQLSIGNLRIKPQLSEEAFTAKMPFQKDRYDVDIKNIILKEVNLAKIIEKQIFANEITASNGSIKIYRDVSKPLDGISKIGNYPQQLLIKSDIPIDIRHAFLNNFYIEYKEKNTFTGKAGTIKFNDSRITLSNITNVPSAIRSDGIATAELDTKVIHDIPFSVSFKFFLGDTGGKFYVKGNVGSFDMKSLNEISKTLALLEIDKGNMQNAAFDFSGNDLSTRGHLVMKYTDLKVALLKKDKAGVFL